MKNFKEKKAFADRVKELNPMADVMLDQDGFIHIEKKDCSDLQLPDNHSCLEDSNYVSNTISLRHIYDNSKEFIVTLVVYQV